MDGMRQPVGEQPTSVYWVRRLAVVLGIVALGLGMWALFSFFGSDASPGATPDAAASVSPSPSDDPTVAVDPARACTDQDISVVTTTPATFSGSKAAEFTVTVELTSGSPCTVDPTTGGKVVVKSGDETWFNSASCSGYAPFGTDAEPFILQDDPRELTASWNYGRGDAACGAELVTAKPGYYWVTVTVQGVAAEPVQFQVT